MSLRQWMKLFFILSWRRKEVESPDTSLVNLFIFYVVLFYFLRAGRRNKWVPRGVSNVDSFIPKITKDNKYRYPIFVIYLSNILAKLIRKLRQYIGNKGIQI